jgi:CRISPR/Cas system-associated exonuclease Cas4 (RecB family)
MIEHLSASQINLYIQCSLKYKYQYIDQIPKPFKPSGLAFGSVMHSAIEWLHKERIKGKQVSLERLYKIFETDWFSLRVDTRIQFKDGEDEVKLLLTGKEMLGIYFNSPLNSIKSAEVPFHVPLLNISTGEELTVPLEGIIDLIEKDDVIVEFKTSARSMDPETLNDYLQLTAYSYAYRTLFGRGPKTLKVINFVKAKTPKMVVIETSRENSYYERFFYIAREVLKGINSGLFLPKQSFMCKDCEYEGLCKKWDGNGTS